MNLNPHGKQRRSAAWLVSALLALTVLAMSGGEGGPRPIPAHPSVPMPAARTTIRPDTEMVGVTAQISGKVVGVRAPTLREVTEGTVLVQLDSTAYRDVLTHARARSAAAQRQVFIARSDLAAKERAVGTAVRAALNAVPSPSGPARTPTRATRTGPQPGHDAAAAALDQVRAQLVAAQAEVVRTEGAKLAIAQRTMERDRSLLSQGLIPQRQLTDDSAAYQSALAQAQAAQASLQRAQGTRPDATERADKARSAGSGVAQAQRTVAAAQQNLRTAQSELAAVQEKLDRDRGLLADGAIPAQQVATDTVNYDAATARAAAAAAAVRQTQAQVEATRRAASSRDAASHQATAPRPDLSRAQAMVSRAQATILAAQQAARQLAASEATAVSADAAIREAELDIARTSVRAPVDGWVASNTAKPGEAVRAGQLLLWLAAPRGAAERLQQIRRVAQAPVGGDGRLGRIEAEERRALTRLDAESERIRAIALGASKGDHIGPIPASLGDGLSRPVWGEITSGYGWRIHPIFQTPEFHTGIDIAAAWGTPVEAPADGRVIYAGEMPANGTLVILDHGNGFSTTYSHLSSYAVRVGERVHKGQVIAKVGSTGWSTGPHLFFEVRENGRPVNPLRL